VAAERPVPCEAAPQQGFFLGLDPEGAIRFRRQGHAPTLRIYGAWDDHFALRFSALDKGGKKNRGHTPAALAVLPTIIDSRCFFRRLVIRRKSYGVQDDIRSTQVFRPSGAGKILAPLVSRSGDVGVQRVRRSSIPAATLKQPGLDEC